MSADGLDNILESVVRVVHSQDITNLWPTISKAQNNATTEEVSTSGNNLTLAYLARSVMWIVGRIFLPSPNTGRVASSPCHAAYSYTVSTECNTG